MIQSIQQIQDQLLVDDSSRQHLRNLYLAHLQQYGLNKPLLMFVEGSVSRVLPGDKRRMRVVFEDILTKSLDTTTLYDQQPYVSTTDHLNCFCSDQSNESYQFEDHLNERVVFIGKVIVYRRSNNTLDISFQVYQPCLFYKATQDLQGLIDDWQTHLLVKGIKNSKVLHEECKQAVYSIKNKSASQLFLFVPFNDTEITLAQKANEMVAEYDRIKALIHEPLAQEFARHQRAQRLAYIASTLKSELPESLVLA